MSQALDAVNALVRQQPVPLPDGALAVPVPPPRHPHCPPSSARRSARPAGRRCIRRSGPCTARAGRPRPLPQQVGLSLRTVQRDLRTATFAGRRRRSDRGDSVPQPL